MDLVIPGGDLLKRLSGLDATFLYLETPRMHLHVGALVVFDPPEHRGAAGGAGGEISFERLKDVVASRLHLLPPFRRRVVQVPFHLDHPVWVDDPHFDLEYHMRRVGLPGSGGSEALSELVADVISRPLDLERPLWEIYFVEGLESNGVAVIAKAHHAAIDGVSGTELAALLFDLEPGGTAVPPPEKPWQPERIPSEPEMLRMALGSIVSRPLEVGRLVGKTIGALLPHVEAGAAAVAGSMLAADAPGEARAGGGVDAGAHSHLPLPLRVPKTSFNSSLSTHRRVAITEVPLSEVKKVREIGGGSVNDVVLAGCAGGLREYLRSRGELPSESLVALVPISVRRPSEKAEMGNRIAAMLIELGSDIDDPLERLSCLSVRTRAGKDRLEGIGSTLMSEWADQVTPLVAAPAARVASNSKLFSRIPVPWNVIISNVPGPEFPLYASGSRMTSIHPFGPLVEGVGLNITVMSYMGMMYFGIVGCRDLVPEIKDVASFVEASFHELNVAAVASKRERSRRARTVPNAKAPTKV